MNTNKSTCNSRVKESDFFPEGKLHDYENEYKELLDEQFEKEQETEVELNTFINNQFTKGLSVEMVVNLISSSVIRPNLI